MAQVSMYVSTAVSCCGLALSTPCEITPYAGDGYGYGSGRPEQPRYEPQLQQHANGDGSDGNGSGRPEQRQREPQLRQHANGDGSDGDGSGRPEQPQREPQLQQHDIGRPARDSPPAATTAASAVEEFGDIDAILNGTFDADAGLGQENQGERSSSTGGSSNTGGSSSSTGGGSEDNNSIYLAGGDGGGSGGADATREEIGGLRVPELKERCKALGLKVGGKKAELQARILEALQ